MEGDVPKRLVRIGDRKVYGLTYNNERRGCKSPDAENNKLSENT